MDDKTVIQKIKAYARELSLTGMAAESELLLENARRDTPAYSDFTLNLLNTEILCRRKVNLERRTKTAKLPLAHDLDQYDHGLMNGMSPAQLKQLRELIWLDQNFNMIQAEPVSLFLLEDSVMKRSNSDIEPCSEPSSRLSRPLN